MLVVRATEGRHHCVCDRVSLSVNVYDYVPLLWQGVHAQMRPFAYLSLVFYAIGFPVLFAFILYKYRNEIRADQELRMRGTGNSRATNPYFHIRQRFQKLYGVFSPDYTYWRLVLLGRKFGIAGVAIMFSSTPGFQAWWVMCEVHVDGIGIVSVRLQIGCVLD